MKPSLFFILLLKLNVVNAQQASLTRANLADQQRCYQQGRQYVADENVTRGKLNDYDNSLYGLSQAHYEPKTQHLSEGQRSGTPFVGSCETHDHTTSFSAGDRGKTT
jgi:hypothetical protein